MGEKVKKVAMASLVVIGAATVIVSVMLFMVGMEELHLEAWKDYSPID